MQFYVPVWCARESAVVSEALQVANGAPAAVWGGGAAVPDVLTASARTCFLVEEEGDMTRERLDQWRCRLLRSQQDGRPHYRERERE